MESPNRMALDLVDEAIDFADELNVGVHHLEGDAALLDFGTEYDGGVEAGLLLAEVATGGLATVQTRLATVDGAALTHVELSTDHPALSLLGCQAPRWPLDLAGEDVLGGGPAQLFRPDAPENPPLDYEETFDFAVLVVESDRLPDDALVEAVAAEAGVPTSGVFVLSAPDSSVAGRTAFAARAAEWTVRRLVEAGCDPATVRSIVASAPVAPLASTEGETRSRSAAAIAHGGRAHVVLESDVERPEAVVATSAPGDESASRDVLGPAQVTVDVVDGPTHVVGTVDERRLAGELGLRP